MTSAVVPALQALGWSAGLGGPAEAGLFALTVLALNATPGVDLLLTLTRTVQGGARAGVAAALGINAGCLGHALAAAFGLAALLAVSATAFTMVKLAGAAYLLWLAWGMARQAWRPWPAHATADGPTTSAASSPRPNPGWRSDFLRGLVTNLLNPKVGMFFLAFLPQFIQPATVDKTRAFLLLGGWFVVQSTLFSLALVACTALAVRALGRVGPGLALGVWAGRLKRLVQGGVAILFAALALKLALQERA